MKEEKSCKNCIHYPCTKKECDIENKNGCNEYKSIIKSAIEIIDKCSKEE